VKQGKAVFLGRFQPFHLGHYRTVKSYRSKFQNFELVIGSSKKSGTEKNPLTFEERKGIIRECFPEVEITPLEDEDRGKEGYRDWAKRFEDKTDPDTVITRNDLVERLVEKYTDAEVEEHQLYRPGEYSGTELRKRIREQDESWREIAPECAEDKIAQFKDRIARTG
jgi:nicotinamide-nucleotide adenylyltransferase